MQTRQVWGASIGWVLEPRNMARMCQWHSRFGLAHPIWPKVGVPAQVGAPCTGGAAAPALTAMLCPTAAHRSVEGHETRHIVPLVSSQVRHSNRVPACQVAGAAVGRQDARSRWPAECGKGR